MTERARTSWIVFASAIVGAVLVGSGAFLILQGTQDSASDVTTTPLQATGKVVPTNEEEPAPSFPGSGPLATRVSDGPTGTKLKEALAASIPAGASVKEVVDYPALGPAVASITYDLTNGQSLQVFIQNVPDVPEENGFTSDKLIRDPKVDRVESWDDGSTAWLLGSRPATLQVIVQTPDQRFVNIMLHTPIVYSEETGGPVGNLRGEPAYSLEGLSKLARTFADAVQAASASEAASSS